MKIVSMQFKVTTSRWICHKCKKPVRGENGFIYIKCVKDFGYYPNYISNIRICWNCLIEFLKESKEDRKNREDKYLELAKKAIIRKL